jgi:hypothetical protein
MIDDELIAAFVAWFAGVCWEVSLGSRLFGSRQKRKYIFPRDHQLIEDASGNGNDVDEFRFACLLQTESMSRRTQLLMLTCDDDE